MRHYPDDMTTVVVGEHPEVESWLAERRALGLDRNDEVWEGVYHVAPNEHARNGWAMLEIVDLLRGPAQRARLDRLPTFNLGTGPTDYRVPDAGWVPMDTPLELYMATATVVLEVRSPGDTTDAKISWYDQRGVQEILVADPIEHTIVAWSRKIHGHLIDQTVSTIFNVDLPTLAGKVRWR